MREKIRQKFQSPWFYVIVLYLPFGFIAGTIPQFPHAFLKLLGFPNELIGIISVVGIITALRFLYAPWLDGAATKRRLSILTPLIGAALMFCLAGLLFSQPSDFVLLAGLMVFLFVKAIDQAAVETSVDGYYIRALNPTLQAQFIGIKTTAMRIGSMSASMGFIWLAAKIAARYGAIGVESLDKTGFYIGFGWAYVLIGVLILICAIANAYALPVVPSDEPVKHRRFALKEVLVEYFAQPRVAMIILVILTYRLGQGFMLMRGPFLLDPYEAGGLNTPATTMPVYMLLTDVPWVLIGGILGGYTIKWFGLKKVFVPLALFMSLPNLYYAWLAWVRPTGTIVIFGETLNKSMLLGSSFESLGYGLSFSAIFYYMHITATMAGRNKTSILAVSCAFSTSASRSR